MTITVNIHEAKTHLSRLLERVAGGERVVISRAGKPIAELVPLRAQPLKFGTLRGRLRYDDATIDGLDPDIRQMFSGDDVAP